MTKIQNFLIAIGLALILYTSCSDDTFVNPTPAPLPTNELADATVNPGDDFYGYCNGTWIKNHPLREGEQTRMYWTAPEYTEEGLAKLLMTTNDAVIKKLMQDADKADPNAAELAALQQKTNRQLAEIDRLTTLDDVIAAVANMGMKGYNTGIRLFCEPVERRVQIVAEVILPTSASAEQWQKMTGCSDAEARKKAETCSTIINQYNEQVGIAIRTVPYKGNEVVQGRRLLAKAVGVPVERLIYGETIDQDNFMKQCVTDSQVENWKMLLKQSIVDFNYKWSYATKEDLAEFLTNPMHPFAYRVTKIYCETFKNELMRDFVYTMVDELKEAFVEMIETNDWLSSSTKQAAIDKCRAMEVYVGYPDTWDEKGLGSIPNGNSLLEDMELAGEEWSQIVNNLRTDTPTKDDVWYSLSQGSVAPYNINAMNMTETNGIYVFNPMLLPNICTKGAPDSYNYGRVGIVIGHEIGHGFDTAGYLFGSKGEWQNWWTEQDAQTFRAKAQQLADCNSQYYPYPEKYPDLHSFGDQTSVEDVADLNGANAAYIAMQKHYKSKGATDEEMLKAKREFFLAYGNLWAGSFSEQYIINRINTNIHSVGPLRINGIVRHMDDWYKVYDIKPSDKLYLDPKDRIHIWNK